MARRNAPGHRMDRCSSETHRGDVNKLTSYGKKSNAAPPNLATPALQRARPLARPVAVSRIKTYRFRLCARWRPDLITAAR